MKLLGILGGMGPLASAEFLDTVYRLNLTEPEQAAPSCALYSDPSFPDRTEAILKGDTRVLTERLTLALEALRGLGAERTVIACVTIHHVLPQVPLELRERVVSLIDLTVDEILRQPRPLLLLCTSGTRAARIFESHPRWRLVEDHVIPLEEEDQRDLHRWIYRIKASCPVEECLGWLDTLAARYGREGFVFGCTELHLLSKELFRRQGRFDPRVVDPLLTAARDLPRLMGWQGPTGTAC